MNLETNWKDSGKNLESLKKCLQRLCAYRKYMPVTK